ncbi:hypothetical protein ABW20_dc0106811 [Dactylellina cionopaga]|nr:hypothetical protein ABW20_dc0106811 [Dactylellina cionopaga]
MTLPNGRYIIKCKANNQFVGRNIREDLSLNPKRVVNLPEEADEQPLIWEIQKRENGYDMRARGSHTAIIDNKLYAVLLEQPVAEEWVITPRPQHGQNIYT